MRRKALLLCTILLLAGLVMTDCGPGCLSCQTDADNNFSCAVCDAHNDYYRKVDSTLCEKVFLDNCEVPSPNYLCYRCMPGFILDQVGGKCLKVPPTSSVPNCHRYTSSGVCQVCDTGYYMTLGECKPIKEAVSECLRYSTEDHCSVCNDGFYLITKTSVAGSGSITTTECVAVTEKENCQGYSLAQCDKCKTNLIINRNYLNSGLFNLNFLQTIYLKSAYSFQMEAKEGPVCVSPEDTFCANIKSSTGDCLKCMTGYYFDEQGMCIKNPEDAVSNCLKYNSPNDCKECMHDYYLESNECKLHTKIENCSLYSKTSDQCIECNTEHYLSSNECKRRQNIIIPQCKNLKIDEDLCEACIDGYYTYSNNLGCQKMIPDCKEEEENTNDNSLPRFICKTCEDDFYPANDKLTCMKQHVANCDAYTLNTNTCTGCDPGFYYDSNSNSCLSEFVPNCKDPDTSNRGKCSDCRDGFYKDGNGDCHPYTVTNCTNKNPAADECTSCDEGAGSKKLYWLDPNDKRCRPYTLSGCTTPKSDSDKCETCDTGSGYVKDPNDYCRKNPSPGCANYNWTSKTCKSCTNQGTDYYLDTNTKTCQQYSVEGCVTYSDTENKCSGSSCQANYYMKSGYCFKYDLVGCKSSGRNPSENECTSNGCETGYYFDSSSKLCQRYSINLSACQVPSTTDDTCTNCKAGYYKDPQTSNCFWLTLPGCSSVDANNPSQCSSCDNDFFTANSPAGVCLPRTAMNCNATVGDKDECSSCNYSQGYALDTNTKSCVKSNIIGCNNFNSTTGVCDGCISGLYLQNNSCQVLSSPHCLDYNTSNGECTKCEHGFYLNSGSCSENTAANCAIKKTDANECHICNKGFYSNSGTCTAVTKKNCFKTSEDADECESCIPGYTLASNNCDTPITRPGTKYGCLYNDATDACTQCKDGFFNYNDLFKKVTLEGCNLLSNNICGQCDPYYELQGDKSCKKVDPDSLICIQTKLNETDNLSDNTSCAQCKNPNTHFITGDVCTAYTAANETPSCEVLDPSADGCLGCSKDYPAHTAKETSLCLDLKFATAPTLTNVENCASIKFNSYLSGNYECAACDVGYVFDNSSPKKCISPGTSGVDFGYGLDDDINPFTPVGSNGSKINNCEKYLSLDSIGIICNKCKDGYVGKIHNTTDYSNFKIKPYLNFWDANRGEYTEKASSLSFRECTEISSINNYPDNTSVLPTEPHPFQNCESYVFFTNELTSYCIKCKPGFVGTPLWTINKADGTEASNNSEKVFVLCKDTTTDFLKTYSFFNPGVVNPDHTKNFAQTFSTYFNYDSCPGGRHFLIFMRVTATDYYPGYVNIGGNASPNMMCMDNLSANHVENCQVHRIITADNETTPIDAQNDEWTCGACKPGYKMGGNFHDNTQTCTPIENCEMGDPTKNSFLGNCETCKKGFAWSYTSDNYIDYQSCVYARGDNQCQAFSETDGNCKLCKVGFEIRDGKCVNQLVDSRCEVYAFPVHGLVSQSIQTLPINVGFFLKYYGDKPPVYGCGKCKPGYINVTVPADQKVCGRSSHSLNRIPNCNIYNVKDLTVNDYSTLTCEECNPGYALTPDSKNCTQNVIGTEKMGCKKLDMNLDCVQCHSEYLMYSGYKLCIPKSILDMDLTNEYDNELVFKEGLKPKNFTNQLNIAVPIEDDDPCSQYLINKCIKCKDINQIPVIITHSGAIPLKMPVNCVNVHSAQAMTPKYISASTSVNIVIANVRAPNVRLENYQFFVYDSSNKKRCASFNFSDPTCLLRESEFYCKKCIPGYYLPNNSDSLKCLPIPVNQCAEYDYTISKCTKCLSGHFLNSSFECQKRIQLDCREFSENTDSCVVCKEGFFKGSDNAGKPKCMPYTQKNCAEFFTQGDYCYKCIEGFYLDGNTGSCKRFDQTGCLRAAQSKNLCLECKDDYYLNDDGECKLSTVSNCRVKNPYSNTCITCEEGSYLNASLICQYHTASNCKAYHNFENKCKECFSNSYLKDGKCKQYTAINCLKYNPVADSCLTCVNSSYFADSGGSCKSYSVKNCKQLSRTSNSCLSCVTGTYKHNDQCKEYTVENCYIFNKYTDGCMQCIDGFYLNDDMRCVAYTVKNCRVFFRHSDRCKICEDGHYKDSSFKCHQYDINRCARFHSNENKCLACQDGFYLENGKCIAYSVQNCREFHPFENKCLSCNSRFYYDDDESCKPYDLQNCDLLDAQKDRCLKCSDNFFMKADSTCEPYTKTCKTYNTYADECLSCTSDHHLVLGNDCKKNDIPNCVKYKTNKNECDQCESGYLLKDNICNKYTARNCLKFKTDANKCEICLPDKYYMDNDSCLESTPVTNCLNYKTDQDKCNECKLGFYLQDNKCWKNPEGIPKCTHYNDPKTCRRCVKGMYLKDNVCIAISSTINNCENYIGDQKCGECETGFLLDFNNTCSSPTNPTCATYIDLENCKTCGANKILKKNEENNRIDCVDSGIENCFEAVIEGENTNCAKCIEQHVLNENKCTVPEKKIDGCNHYQSETECQECLQNYLLSFDRKSCILDSTQLDSSCHTGHLNATPQCFLCKPGFKFDQQGNCEKCGGDGCDLCASKGDSCRLCKKGYYMSKEMQCVEYEASTLRVIEDDGTFTSEEGSNNGSLISFIMMNLVFVFGLLFLRDQFPNISDTIQPKRGL